jgi:glycosyltransferase involved in cell wall biosynthesis
MKYSILLPTRSRGRLIGHMIRAVLEQRGSFDFELVISNNHSTDDTDAVLDTFNDPRIRRIRPNNPLSMTDNWEFVLDHATGDRIIFVEDDDVISTCLLLEVDKVLASSKSDIVTWARAGYIHANHFEVSERNTLGYVNNSNTATEYSSKFLLDQLFRLEIEWYWKCPTMRNSCCSHKNVTDVKSKMRSGRFFTPSCPDFSAAASLLATVKTIVHLDKPLMMFGLERESNISATIVVPEDAFWAWFGEDASSAVQRLPLSGRTFGSLPVETLLHTKELMPGLEQNDINWRRYFAQYYNYVRTYERDGNDASKLKKEFWYVLSRRPLPFSSAVVAELAARWAKDRLTRNRRVPGTYIKGAEAGFSDMTGARMYLDKNILMAGA